jgi:hypothetical protein
MCLPPSKPTKLDLAEDDLPEPRALLSHWHQAEEFEHLAQCQQVRDERCKVSMANYDLFLNRDDVETVVAGGVEFLDCSAKCVASDDPRLKP